RGPDAFHRAAGQRVVRVRLDLLEGRFDELVLHGRGAAIENEDLHRAASLAGMRRPSWLQRKKPFPVRRPKWPPRTSLRSSGQGLYFSSPSSRNRWSIQVMILSSPTRSAYSRGPVFSSYPTRRAWSTASAEATPSMTRCIASLMKGMMPRVVTYPGES